MHKKISTLDAPKAIGPYSQAIIASGSKMLFISGQIPLDPKTMQVESTEVVAQTRLVLKNLQAILKEAQADISSVVKTTVYLKSMDDFAKVNEEYEKLFTHHKPARVCIEVARLPRDVLVEIDAIAVI